MQIYTTHPVEGYLYKGIKLFFAAHPLLHWSSIGALSVILFGLLIVRKDRLAMFPRYLYFSLILSSLTLLDLTTMPLPLITVYLFLLSFSIFRSGEEDPTIITTGFTSSFILMKAFVGWHDYMYIELFSQSMLFLWAGWMSVQVKLSFSDVKRSKDKNKHLIEKMREAQKRVHELQYEIEETYRRDYLTGAYNFSGFQKQVTESIANCRQSQYHVICIDLTNFQQVNLREGIDVGDKILVRISLKLKKVLPSFAHIARYNGDQFAIGLMGNRFVLRRCLENIEKIMQSLKLERTFIDYCAGTATYPQEARDGDQLIRLAEQRLSLEQRRVQHKEEERRRHLEKLSALGQLAAGLAHEIRNPLTSIRGFVQISSAESKSLKKWESVILPEIDRINDLLKQFLTLSESKPAQFTKFNLDQLIRDVLRLLQPKSFLMGHELKEASPDTPVQIEADPEQLKQVLINLIQNGLESLSQDGVIEVNWKALQDRISIQIKDNGAGITPEHLSRIFDPFFTTKGEGTGMGLSICHRIVAEHGGHIHVTTRPGRGTTFHIHLPISQLLNQEDIKERPLIFQQSST